MPDFLDLVSWGLLLLGSAFVLIGGIGSLRLPNFYTRLHAASLTDTMGAILILVGLMLQTGFTIALFKLFSILVFLLMTGPTATYALANAALMSGLKPDAKDVGKLLDSERPSALTANHESDPDRNQEQKS